MLDSVRTLDELLGRVAEAYSPQLAVADEHRRLSFCELRLAADRWAQTLAHLGFAAGSHIGLLAANSCEWLAAAFGVWRAGCTLVPISTFVTARELAEVIAHADLEGLILQPRMRSRNLIDLLSPSMPRHVRHVMVMDPERGIAATGERSDYTAAPTARAGDSEALACILYTSGTTGRPKGVMLSHRAILATTTATADRSGWVVGDSLLSSLPLFWVAGLVIRALPTLSAGCGLIVMETFTPEAAIAALERHAPTAIHLRPPQVAQLLAHQSFRPAHLATVRKGNGKTEWFAGHLPADARFITGYGMTEMAGYVTALDGRTGEEARGEPVGSPLPGVELAIVNGDGTGCRTGEVGEVVVRGPGLFSGYHKDAEATRQAMYAPIAGDRWFKTGDLGFFDEQRTFHFSGRSKDLLRVKGINVSPLEVEMVLATHASVEAIYVVGLPVDGLDQTVVALVVACDSFDEQALRAHAARELSPYKRPSAYLQIERGSVPFGQTAKPQRAQLAAIAAAHLSALPPATP